MIHPSEEILLYASRPQNKINTGDFGHFISQNNDDNQMWQKVFQNYLQVPGNWNTGKY